MTSGSRLLVSGLLLLSGWLGIPGLPRLGVTVVESVSQDQLYALMDNLFTYYRPEVRPSTAGEPTYVFIEMYLLSIQDLNEKSQVLESSIIIEALWHDDWLSWNETQYGDLTHFLYPQSRVWLPDIVIENSVESQSQLGYNTNKVNILHTGYVYWKPSRVIRTGCDIDVTYYPFDTQTCNIVVSTWMSTKDNIEVEPRNGNDGNQGLVLNRYSASGTWELLSNTMTSLPNENDLTRIQFTLKLKRLRTYYVLNIILPVLFLSFTASMVFFLPAEAGEKIGMGITVLLAYAVYLTIIADNMPQTSLQVSYLAVYLTLLLGLTAMGVVLAVVVLHIHHKPDDCQIGERTERITRKLRKVIRLYKVRPIPHSQGSSGAQSSGNEQKYATPPRPRSRCQVAPLACELDTPPRPRSHCPVAPLACEPDTPPPSYTQNLVEEKITWPKVAEALDRIMFVTTSLLITLITVVFLSILALGS